MVICLWLKKAREDLIVAEDELGRITWASVFHSQQAAEKALKALLIALHMKPPRTHEVEQLLHLLQEKGFDTSKIVEAAKLTDYAVEARYPDFGEEPGEEEAVEALELAKQVVDWVKERLKETGIEC